MHCQRETAEKIVAKNADFVLMVKGNQAAMVQFFDEEDSKLLRCRVSEKNRDRQETLEVAAIPVPKDSAVARRQSDRWYLSQSADSGQTGIIARVLHQQPALSSAGAQSASPLALEHRELRSTMCWM